MWASTSTSLIRSEIFRILFNGRERRDLLIVSCDAETRFYGRPKGVRTTERGTTTRKTERIVFLRVSAISRPAPLFCMLFSGKTELGPNSKPAQRLLFGEDEQRNGRDLPLAAGRGIWSLRGRMPAERQLRSRNYNGTAVNTKNIPRLRRGIASFGRK